MKKKTDKTALPESTELPTPPLVAETAAPVEPTPVPPTPAPAPMPPKVNIPLHGERYMILPKSTFKIICLDDENIIIKITSKELTVRTIEDQ